MQTVYPTEPLMHAGNTYVPGQSIKTDDIHDVAAILAAGRGTLDADVAKVAAKVYEENLQSTKQRAAA